MAVGAGGGKFYSFVLQTNGARALRELGDGFNFFGEPVFDGVETSLLERIVQKPNCCIESVDRALLYSSADRFHDIPKARVAERHDLPFC